jgi:hypothetical protein
MMSKWHELKTSDPRLPTCSYGDLHQSANAFFTQAFSLIAQANRGWNCAAKMFAMTLICVA